MPDWDATIRVPSNSPDEDSKVYELRLNIPKQYPAVPPVVTFKRLPPGTFSFVDANGTVRNDRMKQWDRNSSMMGLLNEVRDLIKKSSQGAAGGGGRVLRVSAGL